jgi:AbrB family looped-hinge helix DNA binding protein
MEATPTKLQIVAKVIRDGRITLPIQVRETLGIKDGDKVLVDIRKIEK